MPEFEPKPAKPALIPTADKEQLQGATFQLARPNYNMAAPAYTPSALAEIIAQLNKNQDSRSDLRARLIATVRQRLEDVDFWDKTKIILEEKYKSGVGQKVLGFVPVEFKDRLNLTLLGGEKAVVYEAFLNQLAFMSYSNALDLSDVKGITPSEKGSTRDSAAAILTAAGYEALPTIQGLWGFQMRVFRPVKGKKAVSDKTVLAFRGTEGVKVGMGKAPKVTASGASQQENEGFIDTMTDFVPYPTGYSQYEANEKGIINPVLKGLGNNLVAVGHSLGGALAQITAAKHPNQFKEVQTFQGAKIEAEEVAKAEKANAALRGTYYSVNGDVVPGSGEASIAGEKHRFERSTPVRLNPNVFDAVGGHNSPIMLLMLRQFQSKNLISKENTLAQALGKYGSKDPMDGANLEPTSHDFRPYPNAEAAKQTVVSSWQQGVFVDVYRNNVIYNIYAEKAIEQLKIINDKDHKRLIIKLDNVHKFIISEKIQHTTSSILTLSAIFDKPIADAKEGVKNTEIMKDSSMPTAYLYAKRSLEDLEAKRKDCGDLTKIDESRKKENLARLKFKMADLWYTANPSEENIPLYKKVKPIWEAENQM